MADSNSVFEITVKGEAAGQAVINQFHWMTTDDVLAPVVIPDANVGLFAEQVRQRWITEMLAVLNQAYTFRSLTVKEITGWTGGGVVPKKLLYGYGQEITTGDGATGADTGECLPFTSAGQCFFGSSDPTKRGRGRMKLGVIGEAAQNVSRFTLLYRGAVNTSLSNTFANVPIPLLLPLNTWQHVVLSKSRLFSGPAAGPAKSAARVVNTRVLREIVACQRSRKPRVAV